MTVDDVRPWSRVAEQGIRRSGIDAKRITRRRARAAGSRVRETFAPAAVALAAGRVSWQKIRSMPKTDVWSRSRSVLAMATTLAKHELGHRVRSGLASAQEKIDASELRTRIEQAKVLAESLGRLKGAFMKAGQLLSIDASDLLPPEAVEILAKLQGAAEPVDFAVLREVLVAELGPNLERLADLEEQPAASASIGQVHRARVSGMPVAVKIQYPGIAESIDSDMAILEKVAGTLSGVARRHIDLSGAFEELRTLLHYETDYGRERAYLERFRALVADDPRWTVPRSHPELSTRRVLTMDWADGESLQAWIRSAPSADARTALGRSVLDLYCLEFFAWGIVQTDPNFGNFLVRPDGGLVLLDFGATLEYEPAFRESYKELLRVVAAGRPAAMVEAGVAQGLLDARESDESKQLFASMLRSSIEPFDAARQPFVFRDEDYALRSRETVQRFVRSLRYSPPPRQLLFLHRKLGGIFQLLKRLDVTLDLVPYWEKMVGPAHA